MSPAPQLARLVDPVRQRGLGSAARLDVNAFNRLAVLEDRYAAKLRSSWEQGTTSMLFFWRMRHVGDDDVETLRKIASLSKQAVLAAFDREPDGRGLTAEHIWGDDYVGMINLDGGEAWQRESDPNFVNLLRLNGALRQSLRTAGVHADISLAFTPVRVDPKYLNIQLVDAVRSARDAIDALSQLKESVLPSQFADITLHSDLKVVYQPIISFRSGGIIGWEACARGPRGSYFEHPQDCFQFAEEQGLLAQLESACWRVAAESCGELGPDQKLFLNLHPRTIMEEQFLPAAALKIVNHTGLKPQKVVIEITERHAVPDFSLLNRLIKDARQRGFLIAIDDAGSGYAGLQAIAEVKPDFIKLDRNLVIGIHKDRTKSALVESLAGFAEKTGCMVIAEGIESDKDFEVLVDIGVDCGQGYYLGRPAWPKPVPSEETVRGIVASHAQSRHRLRSLSLQIGDVVEETATVSKETKVREVKEYLDRNPSVAGTVVMDGPTPCGLVMRQHLDRVLATLYGIPLHYEKPISRLMDTSFLHFEEGVSTELVFQAAMNREKANLYDHIVITRDGGLKGIVSMQVLFDLMHQFRLELAKAANPLSGLPGNGAIEMQLVNRARDQKPFSVILVDLDHFKSFNDKYGFDQGDKVILFTSRLLAAVLRKHGSPSDFIGHIGGDDFFIVTQVDCVEKVCRQVTTCFDRLIRSYYDEEDRKAGKIFGHDREGNEKWFPFVAVSMAYVDVLPSKDHYLDLGSILEKLTQLKSYAKSLPGSVFVRDRRTR